MEFFFYHFQMAQLEQDTEDIFFQMYKYKITILLLMDKILFNQPVKNDIRTYDNFQKIATSQGDDYTTGSLLDYPYFKD